MMFDLKGKTAIITGGASGLGADAAAAYVEHGANVALLDVNEENLQRVAAGLREKGARVFTSRCDVSNEDDVRASIDGALAEFGRIDILLNNAGIAVGGGVHNMAVEDWDRAMEINVRGVFLVSKYVVPLMREQKYGKIVNMSSVNALVGDKPKFLMRHVYNASKSAVLGLTVGMAASYGKYNITVNAVCPGLFESGMTQDTLFQFVDFLEGYSRICPMCRPGGKGEVNGAILFFSSEASSYITGQHIVIDGGASIV